RRVAGGDVAAPAVHELVELIVGARRHERLRIELQRQVRRHRVVHALGEGHGRLVDAAERVVARSLVGGGTRARWYRTRMPYRPLIPTADLAKHVRDPAYVVIDCRFKLDDTAWGAREYANGHIPGARYAHLDHDLSGSRTGTNGRHPLPDPEALAR